MLCSVFRKRNKMARKTVLDDFMGLTLPAVPGAWGKLRYMASLRQEDGRYEHWGLVRLYGDGAVQRALREAHRAVFLQVLRTPLKELLRDAELSATETEMGVKPFLDELARDARLLSPEDQGGGSEAHFNSVLQALSALTSRSRKRASSPAA
jgi:hypothetical protein